MSCNQKDSYPKYLTTPLLMKANEKQKTKKRWLFQFTD